jgi:hypothetical protein
VRCEYHYLPYRVVTMRTAWTQSSARLLSLSDFYFLSCHRRSFLDCAAIPGDHPTVAVASHVVPTLFHGCALAADYRRAFVPRMPTRMAIDVWMGAAIVDWNQHRQYSDVSSICRRSPRDALPSVGLVNAVSLAAVWGPSRSFWFRTSSTRAAHRLQCRVLHIDRGFVRSLKIRRDVE